MACSDYINISIKDYVLNIVMNRPDKKNAINRDMYDAMREALVDADTNDDVRVIVISGLEDSFTVGNDLSDFNTRDPNKLSSGGKFLFALLDLQKPLIASVSGLAVGIGTTMLLHCDLVYAAENTRFRLPFVNLGICPEAGSTISLPANSNHRAVSDLLLFGDFFGHEKAMKNGLLTEVVANEKLKVYTAQKALELASKPNQAVIETKRFLKQTYYDEMKQRMFDELDMFGELLASDESKNARAKILSK